MAIRNSVFDTIINSEDEMINQAKIKRGQACVYLRAYIMIRLLLFEEVVISDSSINLNRALRTLILKDEGKGKYNLKGLPPKDEFSKLIEKGNIKLAARDIYKGNFSERLREAQNNKKRVDLPSKEYTELIDELCKKDDNIYWWNADEVSQKFTQKFRGELKEEFSREINIFLRDLSDRLSDHETLTYNMVKNEVLNRNYKEKSDEYQIVRGMLREAYDYNIPEVLKLDYFRLFNSSPRIKKKYNFEMEFAKKYEIPWNYSFNMYAFALFPVNELEFVFGTDKYICYKKAMEDYRKGIIGFEGFLVSLENYLGLLDKMLVDYYGIKYIEHKSKNIRVQIREYIVSNHPAILVTQAIVGVSGIAETIYDLKSNFYINGAKTLLTAILPNIIYKTYGHHVALPEIDHAIVKLDNSNKNSILKSEVK